jgi:prephenate dehydratase/chorismate mutase/prephenate dehydratase
MNKIIGLMLVLMLLVPGLCMAEGNRISFLGPEGTYTEEAARFWFQDDGTFQARETVNDTIADVATGKADFAVIPQENSIGGAVVNYVDALLRAENVCIVGEVVLPISQTLMALPGTDLGDIRTVCSHAQGLAQSETWREAHLPDAAVKEMPSTAAAASYVAESGDRSVAAIAAPGAAELYGLAVLAENVQITDTNRTRFYVLSSSRLKEEGKAPTNAVFIASCEASRIDDIIVEIHRTGLEFVALHDRPEGSRLGTYHYIIEVTEESGLEDGLLAELAAIPGLRCLGSFNVMEKSPAA